MNIKKKSLLFIGMVSTVALLTSGCAAGEKTDPGGGSGSGGTIADMDPIVLKVAEANAEEAAQGQAVVAFMDYIEQATDGKVTFEPYWSSSLFPYLDALGSTGSGLADISAISGAFTPDDTPGLAWLSGLGAVQGESWPASYLQAQGATVELVQESEDLQQELINHNVRALWIGNSPRADLYCKEPLGDPAGKRVRVVGEFWAGEVESLGMIPASLPLTEAYEALERGIIDCISTASGFMTFPQMGITEVAPYYYAMNMASLPGNGYIINLDTWNSFSDELKQIFNEGAAYFAAAMAEKFIEGYSTVAADAESFGITIEDASSANATIDVYNEEAISKLAATAPASISDPEALIARYQDLIEEWHESVTNELGIPTEPVGSTEEQLESYRTGVDVFDVDRFGDLLIPLF
ncbi:hypothetical protein [Microbacterium sp. A93]|uniref:hypothetical protein n=1 Tax=Microbacterium sp. A93 TaxID=3450716 RepID=UPI003F439BD0